MSTIYLNPFTPANEDRYAIWEMLVKRDIQAFVKQDWSLVVDDFIEDGFMGIGANKLSNPDSWKLTYPTLQHYRDDWLNQAKEFSETEWDCDIEQALHDMTNMRDIERFRAIPPFYIKNLTVMCPKKMVLSSI